MSGLHFRGLIRISQRKLEIAASRNPRQCKYTLKHVSKYEKLSCIQEAKLFVIADG